MIIVPKGYLYPVTIDDVTIHVAPLTLEQQMAIGQERAGVTDEIGWLKIAQKTLLLCVKKVEGIEYPDGTSMVVDGALNDAQCEELLGANPDGRLVTACLAAAQRSTKMPDGVTLGNAYRPMKSQGE
jgi:hypothetical protein